MKSYGTRQLKYLAAKNGIVTQRFSELDALRGLAIILMLAYHFFFDLNYFGLFKMEWNVFWLLFQRSIGTLFLLIVGVSLSISYTRNKKLGNRELFIKQLKRSLVLFAIALGITIATWFYPHDGFIVFGIIHLIAISVVLSFFFRNLGKWNLALGAVAIIAGLFLGSITIQSPLLLWLGLPPANFFTLDYYPLLPWFGLVLIGMAAGSMLYKNTENRPLKIKQPALEFLGRHSLEIYLLHQPMLVGIILLTKHIIA